MYFPLTPCPSIASLLAWRKHLYLDEGDKQQPCSHMTAANKKLFTPSVLARNLDSPVGTAGVFAETKAWPQKFDKCRFFKKKAIISHSSTPYKPCDWSCQPQTSGWPRKVLYCFPLISVYKVCVFYPNYKVRISKLFYKLVACVASVSNRVIAQKLERKRNHSFFLLSSQLSRRTRAETLATQVTN